DSSTTSTSASVRSGSRSPSGAAGAAVASVAASSAGAGSAGAAAAGAASTASAASAPFGLVVSSSSLIGGQVLGASRWVKCGCTGADGRWSGRPGPTHRGSAGAGRARVGCSDEVEEPLEEVVEPEHQRREDDQGHEHDEGVPQDLVAGRPRDLAELAADLAQEVRRLGALRLEPLGGRPPIPDRGRRAVSVHLTGALRSSLLLSVHRHVVEVLWS